jgi:hypothetical protein
LRHRRLRAQALDQVSIGKMLELATVELPPLAPLACC